MEGGKEGRMKNGSLTAKEGSGYKRINEWMKGKRERKKKEVI